MNDEMNGSGQGGSTGGGQTGGSSGRGPIDPRGVMAPPPPPGGGGYYGYPPPPPPPRRGLFGGLSKVGAVLSLGVFVFLLGFYAALFQLNRGSGLQSSTYREGTGTDTIAVIPIRGTIGSDTVSYVHEAVDAIMKDKNVKAVVLRVQSPGGGASASDQILHELNHLRKERNLPIVASYGDYAASGGYYVSCQSDYIFAEPTTITGSIGVIAQVPTMQDLLQNKLGVKFETITADGAPQKEVANNMFRDWNDADRKVMRDLVNSIYEQFVSVVAEGRKKVMGPDKVSELATGRIYTAKEALAAKLVDEIGYLDAALDKATALGGFAEKDPPVVFYQPRATLLQMLGVSGPSPRRSSLELLETVLDADGARKWMTELSVPRVMYLFQP